MGQTLQVDRRADHDITAIGESEFLALDDVLRRLRIGRTAGYAMAQQGAFPFPVFRIGRQYRVSKRVFDQVMHGQANQAPIAHAS